MCSLYDLDTFAAYKGMTPREVACGIINNRILVHYDGMGFPALSISNSMSYSICSVDGGLGA